ncbi:MAG TPA: hypothetical protein VGK58_02405 [Lacipirellulaceae bacterium]
MSCRRTLAVVLFAVVVSTGVAAQSAPVFWLSTSDTSSEPARHALYVSPFSTGTLHIWARSDVRLSGVSLDLIQTGGVLNFTSATVHNPSMRWIFTAAPLVSDSTVLNIDGGAIPGLVGNGIGPGSLESTDVLFASVDFQTDESECCFSGLSLRVGNNVIADWEGGTPEVHFGSPSTAPVPGGVPGGMLDVGQVFLCCIESPLIPVDVDLGDRPRGSIIDHTFTVSSSAGDVEWSNLVVNGPAVPAIAPMLAADGSFTWNTANSPLGLYTFDTTVTDQFGSEVGHLMVNLIPEPSTLPLVALAMASLTGCFGQRTALSSSGFPSHRSRSAR